MVSGNQKLIFNLITAF